jgi:hypothetical protein
MFHRSVTFWFFAIAATVATAYGQGASPQHSANHELVPIVADVKTTVTSSAPSGRGFDRTQNGHYFRSRDGKAREDVVFGSIITDAKARTMTFLNNAKKEATVVAMSDPDVATAVGLQSPEDTAKNNKNSLVTPLGDDMVDGHPVHKKLIETGNARLGHKSEIWMATDVHLPVVMKTIGPDRTATKEYRNIRVTDPDPQVFEIPKDYRIVDKSQFSPPLFSHH